MTCCLDPVLFSFVSFEVGSDLSELSSGAAKNCREDEFRFICGSLLVRELLYAYQFLLVAWDFSLCSSCSARYDKYRFM